MDEHRHVEKEVARWRDVKKQLAEAQAWTDVRPEVAIGLLDEAGRETHQSSLRLRRHKAPGDLWDGMGAPESPPRSTVDEDERQLRRVSSDLVEALRLLLLARWDYQGPWHGDSTELWRAANDQGVSRKDIASALVAGNHQSASNAISRVQSIEVDLFSAAEARREDWTSHRFARAPFAQLERAISGLAPELRTALGAWVRSEHAALERYLRAARDFIRDGGSDPGRPERTPLSRGAILALAHIARRMPEVIVLPAQLNVEMNVKESISGGSMFVRHRGAKGAFQVRNLAYAAEALQGVPVTAIAKKHGVNAATVSRIDEVRAARQMRAAARRLGATALADGDWTQDEIGRALSISARHVRTEISRGLDSDLGTYVLAALARALEDSPNRRQEFASLLALLLSQLDEESAQSLAQLIHMVLHPRCSHCGGEAERCAA